MWSARSLEFFVSWPSIVFLQWFQSYYFSFSSAYHLVYLAPSSWVAGANRWLAVYQFMLSSTLPFHDQDLIVWVVFHL
jgi:hypothetical protein